MSVRSSVIYESELYKSVPEQTAPVEGNVKGTIPSWLSGKLIRNGPGLFEIGDTKLNHWFDGMALLHSFTIQSGTVTYSSKFLRSDSYTRNMAANRLVVSEFGTIAVPDPCMTLFQRFQSYYSALTDPTFGTSDNCMVNVYPAGDNLIATSEGCFIHVFSPETLDTEQKVDMFKHVSVFTSSPHPHIDPDGTVYNFGNNREGYSVIKIPPVGKGKHFMEKASVLCSIPAANKLRPSYNHSFAATENYLVLLEQSLQVNVLNILKHKLLNRPVLGDQFLIWDENQPMRFLIVEKSSGNLLSGKFLAPPGLIMHHINAYEDDGHIVLDACGYSQYGDFYDSLDVQTMNDSLDGINFGVEQRRYVLPIDHQEPTKENLVNLDYTDATAKFQEDGSIMCQYELLADPGKASLEMPQIYYKKYSGKPYQYVYGTNHRVIGDILKLDVKNKKCVAWTDESCSVSEPVFVGKPDGTQEDDGVLLSAVLRLDESQPPFLLVLDAGTMTEIGRAEFPDIQMHKDIHGMFINCEQ